MRKNNFAIVLDHPKYECNVGTLVRSCFNFDASIIFTVGKRYKREAGDTIDGLKNIPIIHCLNWEDYKKHALPWIHVGVEILPSSGSLLNFVHPNPCVYILGPEDSSLNKEAKTMCKYFVQIPTNQCLNLSVCGSIVMYDRLLKNFQKNIPKSNGESIRIARSA